MQAGKLSPIKIYLLKAIVLLWKRISYESLASVCLTSEIKTNIFINKQPNNAISLMEGVTGAHNPRLKESGWSSKTYESDAREVLYLFILPG